MATKQEYADELSQYADTWGVVIGMIRAADHRTGGDDSAFRAEVRAILDADERIRAERLGITL